VSETTSRKRSNGFIRSIEESLSLDICRKFLRFQNAARARRPWSQQSWRFSRKQLKIWQLGDTETGIRLVSNVYSRHLPRPALAW